MEQTADLEQTGRWVRLCGVADAPEEQKVIEADAEGVAICLARLNGELLAVDNWCPHRRGPLGEGWIEGQAVVCPWHSWAFDLKTGKAEYPENQQVVPFPVRVEGANVFVRLA